MKRFIILTHAKAKEFIETLDIQRKARVDRFYFLFEEYGTSLPSKYFKKVAKDVWELRPGDVRLFLGIKGNTGVVVCGIRKKSQKTPQEAIELSQKRIKEVLQQL